MRELLLAIMVVPALVGQPAVFVTGGKGVAAQSSARLATADIELLVKQALENRFDARDLPDRNLLGTLTRIAVREEMPGARLRLGSGALPQREGYEFYIVSEAWAQAEANRTGQAVPFIAVDQPVITGDIATISLGVDLAVRQIPNRVKLCCCTGRGRFSRVNGQWAFVAWSGIICA